MSLDYSQYAGQGFEDMTREDYAVPFLGVVQPLSKIMENEATARPGMLLNTVTQETFDGKQGVVFIPSERQHMVTEWKPDRGGFVGQHPMDSELVKSAQTDQEFGKWKTVKGDPKSNDLVETFYMYGIMIDAAGAAQQMIIAFTGSKIKKYKAWMTKARTIQLPLPDGRRINPPLFAHKYRITTVSEKNSKGTFYNLDIKFDGETAEAARLAPSEITHTPFRYTSQRRLFLQ